MSKEEIIISIISTILGSSVLNGIITHLLYKNKLKKELKNKGNDKIANEISESLRFFRDLELQLTVQEIYDFENELTEKGSDVDLFNGECIYPAIFNDWDSYNNFRDQIHICRERHEKNFSCKLALNLVFIDRYLMQLGLFMSENGNEPSLPFWGTLFIADLQKWQRRIDKLLVKEINKYSYKLESHASKKWKILRKFELTYQYKNTILSFLLTGTCPIFKRRKMKLLSELLLAMAEEANENSDE